MKIKVSLKQNRKTIIGSNTSIGRVSFSKIARVLDTVSLGQLPDVNSSVQQTGDTLVYDSNTNTYIVKTASKVDGGEF